MASRLPLALCAVVAITCGAPQPPAPSPSPSAATASATPTPTSFPQLRLGAVSATDPRHAWVVSDQTLLGTADGGATWRRLAAALPPVRDLLFVTPERGFIGTGDAACPTATTCDRVYRTDDGGVSWRGVLATTGPVILVQFVDATHGWVIANEPGCSAAGCDATLLRTVDGGVTWERLRTDRLATARFTSPTHGWMVFRTGSAILNGPWFVRSTDDGGVTWRDELALPRSAWPPLLASAGNAAWILSSEPDTCDDAGCEGWLLWRTLDAGRTWTLVQRPAHQGADEWWARPRPTQGRGLGFLVQPSFATERFGVIPISTSGGPGAGGVLVTTDGGTTWRRSTAPRLAFGVPCGKLSTSTCAIAAGDGVAWIAGAGAVLRTADAGIGWEQQLPDNLR